MQIFARALVVSGVIAATMLVSTPAVPCTTFLMEEGGKVIVGKSYDWDISAGLVLTNKKNVEKKALLLSSAETPVEWTSKYASLTFNQYGREFPNSGMNEAGLMVEVMWLNSTQYAPVDALPAINELQWVQYMLDNFSTVAEVTQSAPTIRVSRIYANIHYLVCDKTSACAAVEYLGGKLVVNTGAQMPAKTLTNDTYPASSAHIKQFTGFGGTQAIPSGTDSLDRFVRASAMALDGEKAKTSEYAFSILDSVSLGSYSKWNLVYDPTELTAYFRTSTNKKIKSVKLSAFEADCTAPVKMLDIDTNAEGDVLHLFTDYSLATNQALLSTSLKDILKFFPAGIVDLIAYYPENLKCKAADPRPSDGSVVLEAGVDPVTPMDSGAIAPDLKAQPPEEKKDDGCRMIAAPGSINWLVISLLFFGIATRKRHRYLNR